MLDRLKNVEPGMPYIDLPLQTIEGKETSLSTYIDKGKYILLDFWASWCPPCRRQTPYLKQLFERYDKRQFFKKMKVYIVQCDCCIQWYQVIHSEEEWKEYIQKNQIKWTQLIDQKGWESTTILTYAIQGIPHLILLGPDGKIISNNPSEKQLSNILSNQLKQ